MIDGNFEDKYSTKNPISRFLMDGFLDNFVKLLDKSGKPKKIVEVGAGEGHLTKIILKRFPSASIWASDISKRIVKVAERNLKNKNVQLGTENLEHLTYKNNMFDLCICCEVLEHVSDPAKALNEIRRVTKNMVIVSVPQEPLWRVLNMLRLRYVRDFGNTPGHVNHWSKESFEVLVKQAGFKIISKSYPLPWQMYLLKKTK